jgi:hypothetical protein
MEIPLSVLLQVLAFGVTISVFAMFYYIFRAVLSMQAIAINMDKKLSKIIELQKDKNK